MDPRPVDTSGGLLLELCSATGCVLLNGRARGDERGHPTFRPRRVRGQAGSPSVLDYGLVSLPLYDHVESFRVLSGGQFDDTSDHNPLSCVVRLLPLPSGRFQGGAEGQGLVGAGAQQFHQQEHIAVLVAMEINHMGIAG